MKKEQYTSFIIKLKEQFGDNKIVNNFILDAEELAKYSEMRIALENLLENLIDNEKINIKNKCCDYLVANDISRKDIGFSSDENEIYILDKDLNIKHFEKDTKQNIAKNILEYIFE